MRYILLFIVLAIAACTKPLDIIGDNAIPTGVGSYPISTNALVDQTTLRTIPTAAPFVQFAAGYGLKVELQFISSSQIKEINLYNTIGSGTRTRISTIPYAAAFSNTKRLDTLIVNYAVPAGQPANTTIRLDYEILNQNSLSVIRTASIRTL